jgi:hypothetical protein
MILDPKELKKREKEFYNECRKPWVNIAKSIFKQSRKYDAGFYGAHGLEYVVDEYVQLNAKKFRKFFYEVLELQNVPEKSYCDSDYSIEIIENTKERCIVVVNDLVCCNQERKFLIVDNKGKEMHIRIIWDDEESDYPKEQYVERPSFQFYKDRDFIFRFEDKYHHTNLGGVYGDSRDKGFVFTYKYWSFMKPEAEDGNFYTYHRLSHLDWILMVAYENLKEEKVKNDK